MHVFTEDVLVGVQKLGFYRLPKEMTVHTISIAEGVIDFMSRAPPSQQYEQ